MTNQPERQQHSKRPYTKPQVAQVPLRPDEAVLGFCKNPPNSAGPGGGDCNPAGGACSTFGS